MTKKGESGSPVSLAGLPPVAQFVLHATAWCRAKLAGRSNVSSAMQLVSQLHLGGKKSLALIEVDGIRFLVGGGPDNVTVIVPILQPASSAQQNPGDLRVNSPQETQTL